METVPLRLISPDSCVLCVHLSLLYADTSLFYVIVVFPERDTETELL